METVFYSLQDFMSHSSKFIYILMAIVPLGLMGFWLFISANDDPRSKK